MTGAVRKAEKQGEAIPADGALLFQLSPAGIDLDILP